MGCEGEIGPCAPRSVVVWKIEDEFGLGIGVPGDRVAVLKAPEGRVVAIPSSRSFRFWRF